ncbi:tyrosine-type recombinase/integrase [Achromobacter xylosoxidans]|uniref:tyrosine-type recombinase/integrase n=1 Tax=Alcaligenes xylosoxydans xylosoxydans TaxID=85698 RepID=UPI00076B4B73|nr:tyrosine-type recombinase/integrase [Achromobacter xylosoxidans]
MGRKRKSADLGLPPRVYLKHGAFYYVHPGSGKWERIGTDINEAKRRGNLYNDPAGEYGTVAYWLGMFLADCQKRIGLPKLRRGIAQRTYDDYEGAITPLTAFFGKMQPPQVQGYHVAQYLDAGAQADRAVRANREKACLSAAFSWMMRKPETGVKVNPCFGIARNPEQKRDRYVDHDEYTLIYGRASKAEQILMELIYRTLQRPEDIITWTTANVVNKREADGTVQRVIRNRQAKTGQIVDIRITPEMEAILAKAAPADALLGPGLHLVRTRNGDPYTYDGISAMLRRRIYKAVKEGELTEPFGFYDLKGKGATDMWLANVPLTEIQVLCGHESVRTTEIYVKSRWRGTVSPNKTALPAV